MIKACSKCKRFKPVDQFYRDRQGEHGRQSKCKVCMDRYFYEYRQRPEVREKRKKQNKRARVHKQLMRQLEFENIDVWEGQVLG